MRTLTATIVLAGLAACAPPKPPDAPAATQEAPPTTQAPPPTTVTTAPPTDAWLGRWSGVEGTYLELARAGGGYAVTIASLDGPRTFEGTAVRDHVEFVRDGRTESIRHASGSETGMKWLARETSCLVVTVGSEGFCRGASRPSP